MEYLFIYYFPIKRSFKSMSHNLGSILKINNFLDILITKISVWKKYTTKTFSLKRETEENNYILHRDKC